MPIDLRTIVIDPGHGGDDHGAEYGGVAEKDINLAIAEFLAFRLEGVRALLTRTEDAGLALFDRVEFAHKHGADLFVSIHCDAFEQSSAAGMSVHIHPRCGGSTHRFAEGVHQALIEDFPDHRDRGIRESDFFVLRKTRCAAMLIECEFLSNPGMRDFLTDPGNQLAIANAIARGILTV